MDEFLKVMKALSDINRVKILKALQQRSMCVCELQRLLDVPQPTVSKHLKILESCGLLRRSKDGLWVNYSIVKGSRRPYVSILLAGLQHWLEDDPEILEMREKIPQIDRCAIVGERAETEKSADGMEA
uniref:ArsR family transcriptional regulator n=1 Tax=Desulfatirhabdium butyrativorans TaxID=340467 RepID=A0A7C4MPQ8_9BACT